MATPSPSLVEETQQIRFCRSPDGVRLALASHGAGPPLVVVSCWLSHLQHDWQSPVWRHFLEKMGQGTAVAYVSSTSWRAKRDAIGLIERALR